MDTIESLIQIELDKLCDRHQIDIILAIESGSRAWGFPSSDSDYDVRIIYRHSHDWYLSVLEQKHTLNEPINGDLDIAGWDVRKSLGLLYNGNAVVHEWLNSPIVYRQHPALKTVLSAFATSAFNPQAAFNHYFYMSRNKLEAMDSANMTAKSFLYGLRTLLCACWIRDFETAPPMEFGQLAQHYMQGESLQQALLVLLDSKKRASEGDIAPIEPVLLAFSKNNLVMLEQQRQQVPEKILMPEDYNCIFRKLIQSG